MFFGLQPLKQDLSPISGTGQTVQPFAPTRPVADSKSANTRTSVDATKENDAAKRREIANTVKLAGDMGVSVRAKHQITDLISHFGNQYRNATTLEAKREIHRTIDGLIRRGTAVGLIGNGLDQDGKDTGKAQSAALYLGEPYEKIKDPALTARSAAPQSAATGKTTEVTANTASTANKEAVYLSGDSSTAPNTAQSTGDNNVGTTQAGSASSSVYAPNVTVTPEVAADFKTADASNNTPAAVDPQVAVDVQTIGSIGSKMANVQDKKQQLEQAVVAYRTAKPDKVNAAKKAFENAGLELKAAEEELRTSLADLSSRYDDGLLGINYKDQKKLGEFQNNPALDQVVQDVARFYKVSVSEVQGTHALAVLTGLASEGKDNPAAKKLAERLLAALQKPVAASQTPSSSDVPETALA